MTRTELRAHFQALADELSHPLFDQFISDLTAEVMHELAPYVTECSATIVESRFPAGALLHFDVTALDYDELLTHPEAFVTPNDICITIDETYHWGRLPVRVYVSVYADLPPDVKAILTDIGKIKREVSSYLTISC